MVRETHVDPTSADAGSKGHQVQDPSASSHISRTYSPFGKWGMYLISCFLQLATCWNLHSSRFLYWALLFLKAQAWHYVQNVLSLQNPAQVRVGKQKLCWRQGAGANHLIKNVDILQLESHKCFRTQLIFVGISFLPYVMCFQEYDPIISELVSWCSILSWNPAPHIYRNATSPSRVRTPHCFVATPSDIAGSHVHRPLVFLQKDWAVPNAFPTSR